MSSSNNGQSKYILPRFRRISSQHSADASLVNHNDSLHNSTSSRIVSSSSTSMISTPSNNIRRVQQQRHEQQQQQQQQHEPTTQGKPKKLISSRPLNNFNVKKKLLNLQQSSKWKYPSSSPTRPLDQTKNNFNSPSSRKAPQFVLRKPANMNKFDYSAFVSYQENPNQTYDQHILDEGNNTFDDDQSPVSSYSLPPPIKESQLKAWDSAEKVTNNLIFDSSSDDEDYGDNTMEDIENATATKKSSDKPIITAIPGYTKGELEVLLKHFESSQKSTHFDSQKVGEQERKLLWKYRQQHQSSQEKAFASFQTLLGKRKIQIAQKKDLLHKIFGYNNNMNHEFITNNTSYSALDNVSNTQKAFHEDKEEIGSLLEEDAAFLEALAETRRNLSTLRYNNVGINVKRKATIRNTNVEIDLNDFDYDKFHEFTQSKLTELYNVYLHQCDDTGKYSEEDLFETNQVNQELENFTLAYLKKCVKEEAENEMEVIRQ